MVQAQLDKKSLRHVTEKPLEELSDEELVTAHLNGRGEAFEALYDR